MNENPKVGDAAHIQSYSDRSPVNVVEVKGNTVIVQCADYKRIDSNGMSDQQEYEYTPNPSGIKVTFTKRKNGAWVRRGTKQWEGCRLYSGYSRYYDFTF